MKSTLLTTILVVLFFACMHATGEPSTYFQIFVPPNNDAVKRDAALIITAIYDNTKFTITDDGADGDTDDSKSGVLMAGQSYVLYIKDNGINDDARYASGGVLKWDGDYFIIQSDKLLFASQSTNSDWQHDWVPSVNKKSIGQKYIIYSPPYTSSPRDINVFAYENNTTVSFQKISTQPKTNTGFTDVDLENPQTLFTRTLQIGEDLIYKYPEGRNVMQAGETYLLVSDKPVTVQYGALYVNERDGGGYVPSENGSSAGELFYFAIPYQATGEQELRVVSWDQNNDITLERYNNGTWINVKNMTLNRLTAGEWVGKTSGNATYPTTFRLKCSPGKKVSVFEGNWFETGSPGTSDMATMVTGEDGTTAGTKFLTYMAPPGAENNVTDPFTGQKFGQQLTHLYLFARTGATVTVKDAYTNGAKISRTYQIPAGKYVDSYLTLSEWRSIYNGTGTPSGPERPYLLVESSDPISVMNTNFNDNWMMYFGSSLTQDLKINVETSSVSASPGDTVVLNSIITVNQYVTDAIIQQVAQDGLYVLSATLTGEGYPEPVQGIITMGDKNTNITFPGVNTLLADMEYQLQLQVMTMPSGNSGNATNLINNATVETTATASIDGQIQQGANLAVVKINVNNTVNLLFSFANLPIFATTTTDSWSAAWDDLNNDGFDDLIVPDKTLGKPNLVYLNNKNGGFNAMSGSNINTDNSTTICSVIADTDNDGDNDILVTNNTRLFNNFYKNTGGKFDKENVHSFNQAISYYHSASMIDYDNDGHLDLFLGNYFPTKFHELHHNNGNATFTQVWDNKIITGVAMTVGATWADYDLDGDMDLFVPQSNGNKNMLYENIGNGQFREANNIVSKEGGKSIASCWGDYDNDGDPDLYVSNIDKGNGFLYRNDRNGQFTKIIDSGILTQGANNYGCTFADLDNDGDLDLYLTNDRGWKFLFINKGNGKFVSKIDELIVNESIGSAYGHAFSDFDRDGDLDLFIPTLNNKANRCYTNNGNTNHWILLTLKGIYSNASAIGANLTLYAGGKIQSRQVYSQTGFASQHSRNVHFGLGTISGIDSIIIHWPSGIVQKLTGLATKTYHTITEPSATLKTLAIFDDLNTNGIKDAGESTLVNARAIHQSTGKYYGTGSNGYKTIALTPGKHTFMAMEEHGILSAGATSLSIPQEALDTIWIPAQRNNKTDLAINMGSAVIRKGFSNNGLLLNVVNQSNTTANSSRISLELPAGITVTSSTIPYQASGSYPKNGIQYITYFFNSPSLEPGQSFNVSMSTGTNSALNVGDEILLYAGILMEDQDHDYSNNTTEQWHKVSGPIDPNDIQVSPKGYGPEGFINAGQTLTYTIRFQNMGNLPASYVEIVDNLPLSLDVDKLEIVNYSHPGLTYSFEGNTVRFEWEYIHLPDSTTSPAGSQGYITFSVPMKIALPSYTKIYNTALIRFDNNDYISTNTVLNTIRNRVNEAEGLLLNAYPNPASDVIYLSLDHSSTELKEVPIIHIHVYDPSGKLLSSHPVLDQQNLLIHTTELADGVYIIEAEDHQGFRHRRKVIVRRQQ